MTTQEFSDEMDVLLNSYSGSANSVELDEYEKSVYLTLAQNQIVKGLYNGTYSGDSFEKTEELRRSLDRLIKEKTLTVPIKYDDNSSGFKLPEDLWFIVYESVYLEDPLYCDDGALEVVPVRYDEWHKVKKNPFRKPNGRRAIRLDTGEFTGGSTVKIVSANPIKNYTVTYLKKPNPIILVPLEERQAIDGITKITECELGTVLHRPILERAVQLASSRIARASNQ